MEKRQTSKIIGVIPARMKALRFPGKPLVEICGRTMIEHIVRRARMCERLDAEIRRAVESFGGAVIMTSPAHERASDRAAEAAESLDADIIVMIQGDEPLITPPMIAAAIEPLLPDSIVECVNLVRRIESRAEFLNRNTIKVVGNQLGDALYFSRASIPALDFDEAQAAPVFKQVCVIPFRREFLLKFARLQPTPLERAESTDMLRVLEHGGRVRLVETDIDTHAVDVPKDVPPVERLMKNDSLILKYNEMRIGERR